MKKKASAAVSRQCIGDEEPWLILVGKGDAPVLAAFDDRLCIIKTGGFVGLMAGALGGERSATFHFRDITGFEYNSGMFSGVLEVLTPSYNGTANRDFWKGSNSSRNADGNSPFTLSNCLPFMKRDYKAMLPEITELRRRIGESKASVTKVQYVPAPLESSSVAGEIERLAALVRAGVLTPEEFVEAKRRVLQGQ